VTKKRGKEERGKGGTAMHVGHKIGTHGWLEAEVVHGNGGIGQPSHSRHFFKNAGSWQKHRFRGRERREKGREKDRYLS
jgi:hypothetical protein